MTCANYLKEIIFTKGKINNMNSPVLKRDIKSIINNFPKKISGPDNFTGKFYQLFKDLFQKIEAKGELSNSFCEFNITQIKTSQ